MTLITGCTLDRQVKPPVQPQIDPNLPTIDYTKIRMIPDIQSIALEWQGSDKQEVNGYYIYRSEVQKDGEKLKRIAQVDDKYTKHFLDTQLNPETQYIYAISSKSPKGTESKPSKAVLTKTLPLLDSVSFIYATSQLPRKVRIEWRPHESYAIEKYILERNTQKTSEWKKIATIKNRLNAEYIDNDLKDNEKYTYRIKAVTFDGIISKPSQSVEAVTKPLPISVSSLMATKDQPRKIILAWDHSPQEDVVAYNIYFSSSADSFYTKLKTVPASVNRIEHIINENSKKYFYKVSTVDKDGLETKLKFLPAVEGQTLASPMQPTITLALIKDNTVILNWAKGDNRAVSYNIVKTEIKSMFNKTSKVIKGITEPRFEDTDITRGITYEYEIQAVDKYNLVSAKTPSASLSIPVKTDKK